MKVSQILTNVGERAKNVMQMPAKKIGLPILIAGTLLGGGGVALANNNKGDKDNFSKEPIELVQNNTTQQVKKENIFIEFFKYMGNPDSRSKKIANKNAYVAPFDLTKTGLTTDGFAEFFSQALKNMVKTDEVEATAFVTEKRIVLGELNGGKFPALEQVAELPSVAQEWQALDQDKDGIISEDEMCARFRFLDKADGKADGKVSYEALMMTEYTDPKVATALKKELDIIAGEKLEFILKMESKYGL